ncbi:MAG: type II secretion system F family protein, partial [Pseudomonadota bacterium]
MSGLLLATTIMVGIFIFSVLGYLLVEWLSVRRLANVAAGKINNKIGELARVQSKDLNLLVGQAQLYVTSKYAAIIVLPLLVWIVLGGIFAPLVTALAIYLLPRYLFKRRKAKRLKQIEEALPNSLMMIASSLRAGSALPVAIQILVREQPGPLGQEFAILLREQKLGVDFDSAMQTMADRIAIPDFHLVSVALRVSREVGGNLAEILDSLANTIRNKAILEGKIKALTAQGTIQGIVMALLPFVIAG